MDAGSTDFDSSAVTPTAAFYTGVRKKTTSNRKSPRSPKKDVHSRLCVFCDSDHQSKCKTVRDITARISIVKNKSLCYKLFK